MNYEELVEKLKADGYIEEKRDKRTVPQTFFREAIAHMQQKYHDGDFNNGWGTAWDEVRKLVMWTYGVSTVSRIPIEKQVEANQKAIALIDILFG